MRDTRAETNEGPRRRAERGTVFINVTRIVIKIAGLECGQTETSLLFQFPATKPDLHGGDLYSEQEAEDGEERASFADR